MTSEGANMPGQPGRGPDEALARGSGSARARPYRPWREGVVHALILLILLVLLFPSVFLRGEMAVPGTLLFEWPPWSHHAPAEFRRATNDTTVEALSQFTVWYSLTQQALRTGEWPLWNPLEFTGMPLLANYQSAVFYPVHVLHAVLDVGLAMTIYVLLKIWICGATAYLCARVMGLRVGAARFVSVAWMLAGFNMIWCYWNEADVSGWAPVVLMGVELLLNGRRRAGFWTAALGGTLILLAGHPETAFVQGAGIGAYFLLRLAWEWWRGDRRTGRDVWAPIGLAVGAWIPALLVCAVQLVPFFEYVRHSQPYGALVEESANALQPGGLVSFWAPRFLGATVDGNFWGLKNSNHVSLVYPGVVTWVGVMLLLAPGPRGSLMRRQAACLLVPALFFVLMAFRPPLVAALAQLPLLNTMWGLWHISFPVFAVACLGGLGVEHWMSRPRSIRDLAWPGTIAAGVTGLVFVVYGVFRGALAPQEGLDRYVAAQVAMAGAFALAALTALATLRGRRAWAAAGVMAVLVAVDLLVAARGLHPTCPRKDLFVETELTRFLKNVEGPVRVSVESSPIRAGMLANYGIEELWGYDGIFPKRILGLFGLVRRGAWGAVEPLCAASYYLSPGGSQAGANAKDSSMRLQGTIEGIDVSRNLRAFPRAFLVGEVRVVPGESEVLDAMCTAGYDPSRVALTEAPPPVPLPVSAFSRPAAFGLQPSALGRATVQARTMTHVTVDAQARQDCVLVLADAYFPGWRAWIDGNPAPIFPVYYAFRGVVIPAGNHTVEYRYNPASFRFGLAVSTVALLASALGSLGYLGRRAKARRG